MSAREDAPSDRLREAKDLYRDRLLAYPNVTGIGIGHRIRGGRRIEEICLRIYVRHKVPPERLAADAVLPRSIDGVPIDVVEGDFRALGWGIGDLALAERRAWTPIQLVGGISVGGLLVTAGTLGASASDAGSGQQLLLSNWHVLCGHLPCLPGEPIVQPGVMDGGSEQDIVARVVRSSIDADVDAACAEPTGDRLLVPEIAGIGAVTGTRSATLGMRVWKSGRTTGLTTGIVDDISADLEVGYADGARWFRDQLVAVSEDATPISLGGDSGSLVVDANGMAVGLLFAGPSDGSRLIANHIDAVTSALGIRIAVDLARMESEIALGASTA